MRRLLIHSGIVIILAITAILLIKIYPVRPRISPGPDIKIQGDKPLIYDEGEWLGIYFQGKKVGYTFTKIGQTPRGYKFDNLMNMTMVVANEPREIKMVARVTTDREYRIQDYFMEMATMGHTIKTTGVVRDKKVVLTVNSQGIERTQEVELDSAPYFHEALEALIKKRQLRDGDSLILPFFDISTQTPSQAILKVIGNDEIVIEGENYQTRKIAVNVLGMQSYLWLDQDGRFLKESSPIGIEMIRERKEKALASIKPEELTDILTFVSVKLDTVIADHLNIKYMKLQIDDLDTVNLDLEDDFQRIISKRPLIIEFVTPDLESIPEISAPGKVEMEFVKPSIYIQSEEPEIVRTAKNIAGIETDKKEVVQRLTNWIYVNLKKRPTVSMPSAVDVLKTMEGDCNEHAILFVAFARALGIPAKIYVGLVNLGNAYYYHAWCAVYLGKWVPVDPTFNQFPADAGHFKLKTGELSEQTKVLKVVGKLKIKVLAYR